MPLLSVVGGKWLAAAAFGAANLGLTILLLLLVLAYAPLGEIGMPLEISVLEAVVMFLTVLPLALLVRLCQ